MPILLTLIGVIFLLVFVPICLTWARRWGIVAIVFLVTMPTLLLRNTTLVMALCWM